MSQKIEMEERARQQKKDHDLLAAIEEKSLPKIRRCLQSGANPNAMQTKLTAVSFPAIHIAIRAHSPTPDKNTEMVRMLIEGGADIEISDSRGITPLLFACLFHQHTIIKDLLALGANPLTAPKGNSLRANSPIKALISGASSIAFEKDEALDLEFKETILLMLKRGCLMDLQEPYLSISNLTRRLACHTVSYLLEKGLNPSYASENGNTLLHHVGWNTQGGYEARKAVLEAKMTHLLIEAGADLDAVNEEGDPIEATCGRVAADIVKAAREARCIAKQIESPSDSPLKASRLTLTTPHKKRL